MEPKLKIQLYLDKRELGVVQPDGTYGSQNHTDYYVNIHLNRRYNIIDEYIDIAIDPLRTEMQRQLINPWFIEFSFFESITSTGIAGKFDDLTLVPVSENLIKKAEKFKIDINK